MKTMEINVSEIYKKNKDLIKICQELNNLINGKDIELYEYIEGSNDYELIDKYNVKSVQIWEEQISFTFGPDEYDICTINSTDLIKIDEY